MAHKSAISFGLVHIPIILDPIIKNNDISFNLLHTKCLEKIKYQKYCPHCKVEVKQSDLVKGFQYASDEYVTFDNQDFEKLKSDQDKTIEIIAFVDLKEIDPIYFEKSYCLKTNSKNKAFTLFKTALNKARKVAIAKTVLGNKAYYAVLRFGQQNIIMNTLYYEEEIRINQELAEAEFEQKELDMALKLIDSMSGIFEPEKYHDEYQNKVKAAIEQKIQGKEVKPLKKKKTKTISDLMEALEKSLKERKGKKYGTI